MPRKPGLMIAALVVTSAVTAPALLRARDGQDAARVRPNYELASRWTSSKVTNKMVFSVTVNPTWFEAGDRFWYAFATSKGQRWMLVDTVKKTKVPLFDPASVAAQLTNLIRVPFDSAHLPLVGMKLIKKDTALQFDVNVPKDTKVPGLKEKADDKKDADTTTGGEGQRGSGGGPPGPAGPPAGTRNFRFEYDLATAKLVLVHPDEVKAKDEKDKEARWPTWASVSPDEKVALFVRGFDLFMMDMENLQKAMKDPRDPSVVETRLTKDGEDYYAYARHLTDEEKDRLRKEQKKEEKKGETVADKKDDQKTEEQKKAEQKRPPT